MYIWERECVFYEPVNVSLSAFVVCLYVSVSFDVYACTPPPLPPPSSVSFLSLTKTFLWKPYQRCDV